MIYFLFAVNFFNLICLFFFFEELILASIQFNFSDQHEFIETLKRKKQKNFGLKIELSLN